MSISSERTYDFVPAASIIAFIFIGLVFLIGFIGRCLALNQSTIRSTQSLDLMIYQIPPKANSSQQKMRASNDIQHALTDFPVAPLPPMQRGPKNL